MACDSLAQSVSQSVAPDVQETYNNVCYRYKKYNIIKNRWMEKIQHHHENKVIKIVVV